MKNFLGHSILAFLEAFLKCSVIFVLQILVIYPLIANGQGKETMRALLDPATVHVSWIFFALAVPYFFILTASFLFFLLDRWNYEANDGVRAFFRIWVPSILTLSTSLLVPLAAELSAHGSSLFDFILGLVNTLMVLALVGIVWWQTQPTVSRNMAAFLGVASLVLFGFAISPFLIGFYVATALALTVFCILTRKDFLDSNPNFRPWRGRGAHSVGLTLAALLAGGIMILSATSVPGGCSSARRASSSAVFRSWSPSLSCSRPRCASCLPCSCVWAGCSSWPSC